VASTSTSYVLGTCTLCGGIRGEHRRGGGGGGGGLAPVIATTSKALGNIVPPRNGDVVAS